jgi:hypothetical protein
LGYRPADSAADLLRRHMRRAWQAITDYQLPIPSSQNRLGLVVMLAVEAELIFFNAATLEPCQEERDLFVADFLRLPTFNSLQVPEITRLALR